MEALRKAEEAKRVAAQKAKESVNNESELLPSSTLPVENLVELSETVEDEKLSAIELSTTDNEEATSQEEPSDEPHVEFSFATEEAESSNLDIPFDFQIDESFGIDAEAPSSLTLENNEVSSASESSIDESSNTIEFSPSLSTEKPSEAIVEEPVVPAAPEPEPTPEAPKETISPVVLETAIEPIATIEKEPAQNDAVATLQEESIRASRDDDDAELARQTEERKPVRTTQKVGAKSAAEESRTRESARAVFSAKSDRKSAGQKRKLLIAASVLALIPLAGGSYLLLNELGVLGGSNQYSIPASYTPGERSFEDVAELADTEIDQAVLPDVSPAGALVLLGGEEAITEALESVVSSINPAIVQVSEMEVASPMVAPPASAESETVNAAVPIVEPQEVAEAVIETPIAEEVAPNPITIVRSDTTPKVDPQLLQAYDAYQANDYIAARAHYQQALRDKPNNRDAIMGLAAVSLKVGDSVNAREAYLRLLQLDPRDVMARVGLLETMPASDPIALESELKSLFEEHPEVAHLAFSLGNLYASQRRWNEAQQSYYDALLAAKSGSAGPVSPDYAFNLAVSLERLNQVRPAYGFYREALEQSRDVNPTFDPRILRERLDALERLLP